MIELELWRSFWDVDTQFDMLNFDSINAPYVFACADWLRSIFYCY